MEVCADIGRSYHRTDCQNRVAKVCQILEELGHVMSDPRNAEATPASHFHKAGPCVLSVHVSFAFQCFGNTRL